jgi:hypothetical protein
MAVDAGDGWADRWQLDVIVGMDLGLVGGAEHTGAMRAGAQRCLDDAIRMFGQRAADAGTTARRFYCRSARFAFWPFEGGVLELSGVLGGALSLVSNSAIRVINEVICAVCASRSEPPAPGSG